MTADPSIVQSATPFQTIFLNEINTDLDASSFDVRLQVTDIANLGNDVRGALQENIFNLLGGDDTAYGNNSSDTISGGDGDDLIYGLAGDDLIYGNDDDDTIFGDSGNDFISGGNGEDVLNGNDGNDLIFAGFDDDIASGNDGNDTVYGYFGDDKLYGFDGADILDGGEGDDTMCGGDGNDAIFGQNGNDDLYGNAGSDTLTGGEGADRFIFVFGEDLAETFQDIVTDFNVEEDVLVFEGFGLENTVFGTNEGFFLELLEDAGDIQQVDGDLVINGSPDLNPYPLGGDAGSNPIDFIDFGTSSDSSITLENVRFDQLGDAQIEFVN